MHVHVLEVVPALTQLWSKLVSHSSRSKHSTRMWVGEQTRRWRLRLPSPRDEHQPAVSGPKPPPSTSPNPNPGSQSELRDPNRVTEVMIGIRPRPAEPGALRARRASSLSDARVPAVGREQGSCDAAPSDLLLARSESEIVGLLVPAGRPAWLQRMRPRRGCGPVLDEGGGARVVEKQSFVDNPRTA